ncbi:MAG: thiolase family protein, partial [Candidatus Neomarinimicrobiota bacterium]
MFRSLRADELFVQVLQSLMDRLSLDPARVDDVYLGCVGQHLEQGKNLARLSWLLAGFPDTVPGMTLNRLCASSFSAVQVAADAIGCGRLHCVIAGGVEHMTHVPMTAALDYHPDLFRDARFLWNNMGLTAEFLAKERQISREEQDRFTQESNRRYFQALEAGFYKGEIVPIATPEGRQDRDQQPRLSSLEALAGLQPVFKEGGTVTAANSSGLGDGAAALVVA